MNPSTESEIFEFVGDASSAAESQRMQLAERFAIDGCYYEAVQWISKTLRPNEQRPVNQRLSADYHPDSRKLRAIDNDVTRLTQKSIASTHPKAVYMDVHPSERDATPDAALKAATHEDFINALIDDSKLLRAAQISNERRCIFGVSGLVLGIEATERGRYLCVKPFDPTCLILDPHVQDRDLHNHGYVIYTDVWTLERLKRSFPWVDINPDDCKTVGDLEQQKLELAQLSNNKMFTRYVRESRSKGVRIYQGHHRVGKRFDSWYVCIEHGDGEKTMITEPGEPSPFGGLGMPFTLLHGYPRADTMWSWGEPAQLKDDQDQKNLLKTLENRIMQQYAHHKMIVDKRWFGVNSGNEDDVAKKLDNRVGAPIIGGAGDRTRDVRPPAYLPAPPPPQFITEILDRHTAGMVSKTHKAPGNFGSSPTHVPFKTTERVLDDADQVASVRVENDLVSYEYLVSVLHGSGLKLLREKDPAVAGMLRREGFDTPDIAILLQSDPIYPDVVMSVQSSTVRHMSHAARKNDLDSAVAAGLVNADEYRQIMADTLQIPLSDSDRQMVDQARKAAERIILGEEWQAIPLGQWNKVFIDTFTRAQLDRRVAADKSAKGRLVGAIQAQYNMWYQERMLANPELMAQAQPAAPAGAEDSTQASPEQDQSVNVADVLDALSQGGGAGVGAQPASAA